MARSGTVYCVDTSALLHAWQRAYPPRRFPKLWDRLDELIETGRLVASIEVFHELQKKDDDVAEWAKERKEKFFRDIDDDTQDVLIGIMATYPRLVDTKTGKSGADPWVIALAKGSPPFVVVTQEAGGSDKSPKIPYVCGCEGLTHIDLLQLIDAEDWTF